MKSLYLPFFQIRLSLLAFKIAFICKIIKYWVYLYICFEFSIKT